MQVARRFGGGEHGLRLQGWISLARYQHDSRRQADSVDFQRPPQRYIPEDRSTLFVWLFVYDASVADTTQQRTIGSLVNNNVESIGLGVT
jgi:hypothetical protein